MSNGRAVARVVAILAGGAVALWIATGVTLNSTAATTAPELVSQIWPAGPNARIAQGTQLVAAAQPVAVDRIDRMRASVRDAALREPVNSYALGTLAALDDLRGNKVRARTLFQLSAAMSRRNVLTQLWLIEDAVARGDIEVAVGHYDQAMRVSLDIRPVLLPVLVSAAANPEIMSRLSPVLAKRPLWWKDYARQLAKTGNSAAMAVSLAALRPDPRNVEEQTLSGNIVRRMLDLGDEVGAVRAANRIEGRGGAVRSLSDANFETSAGILPFAWWLRDEDNIRAYRDAVPNGGTGLRLVTTNDVTGGMAQQLVALRPGRSALTGSVGDVPADLVARPRLTLSCYDGRPIGQFVFPQAPDTGARFRFAADVPANCRTQWITLVSAPAADTNMWIDDLAFGS